MKAWLCIAVVAAAVATTDDPSPVASLNLPCTITEVYDGDTVTVELTVRARVRMLDCWAPELRDPGGKEARNNLKKYEGSKAMLNVPLEGVDSLDDVFTFGRVLGFVYVGESNLSDEQVANGFATKKKDNK